MNKIETPKTLEELFQALRAIRVEINTAKSADFLTGKKQQSVVADLTTCMKGLSALRDSAQPVDTVNISQSLNEINGQMQKVNAHIQRLEEQIQRLEGQILSRQ